MIKVFMEFFITTRISHSFSVQPSLIAFPVLWILFSLTLLLPLNSRESDSCQSCEGE
jgi:hypothetical protein